MKKKGRPNRYLQELKFRKSWGDIKPHQQIHRNPKDIEKERRWKWDGGIGQDQIES